MEDLDDTISTSSFDHLFIKEEEDDPDKTLMEQKECSMAQSGLTYSGTHLSQSGFIKPYLQEMDDLLKSCEELTASPFSSPFSASYNETTLIESTKSQSKEKDAMKSIEEKNISPQGYLVTSYIDTHMDGEGTEDREAHRQSQGLCAIKNRCGVGADLSCQKEMPLTSVGCKLSDTMVEYEGRLLGMLAMLENCMEEAGMDYETQDWDNDASQEYVHISKNPHLSRGPTLVPTQQEGSNKLKAQRMQTESWTGQNAGGDHLSKEGRNEGTVATNGRQQNPVASCENILGFSIERLEKHGNLTTNEGVLDPHSCFSNPSKPLDAENDPTQSEVLNTGYISTNEGKNARRDKTGMQVLNPELPAVGEKDPKMEVSDLGSGISDLVTLGAQMEDCIEEVQCLEKRRRELLAEVLELRGNEDRQVAEGSYKDTEESIDSKVVEVMIALKREEEGRREERKREIQGLREERSEEERRMWKVNLERQGLQEELRKLKRRLFTMARDCAHNQFALSNQQREVDLLKKEEEELHSVVCQQTEEVSQLSTAHKQQLSDLQAQRHTQTSSHSSNTQDELTECRRHSCGDIQQFLQDGLRALEERYEPMLIALLKRREVTAGALVKAKEQAQELRAQLRPLKEEIQKLKLQRACLEEKLKLIHIQRRDDVGQYKETVFCLEEVTRELKTELKIQKRKTKEMEELRDSLSKQLLSYRAPTEDHRCDSEEKT